MKPESYLESARWMVEQMRFERMTLALWSLFAEGLRRGPAHRRRRVKSISVKVFNTKLLASGSRLRCKKLSNLTEMAGVPVFAVNRPARNRSKRVAP